MNKKPPTVRNTVFTGTPWDGFSKKVQLLLAKYRYWLLNRQSNEIFNLQFFVIIQFQTYLGL